MQVMRLSDLLLMDALDNRVAKYGLDSIDAVGSTQARQPVLSNCEGVIKIYY